MQRKDEVGVEMMQHLYLYICNIEPAAQWLK